MAGLLFELDEAQGSSCVRILVLGVGGAGGNAVDRMARSGMQGVEFAVVNTDAQALGQNAAPCRIQIGKTLTRGLGTGAKPELARQAVLEDEQELLALLDGADLVFVTAGMGGGTGTGAAPEVARLAREAGALTVGVVTRPFLFEMKPRMRRAEEGIAAMREQTDTLIVVSNQRLMEIVDQHLNLSQAFSVADEVLMSAVRGVSDMITVPGLINRDFADMREVMSVQGQALMGVGLGRLREGAYGAQEAAEQAVSSPLLEDASIRGARKLLVNITGGEMMSLKDVSEVMNSISDAVGQETDVFLGTVTDADLEDRIQVTLVATGLKAVAEGRSREENHLLTVARPVPSGAAAPVRSPREHPALLRSSRSEAPREPGRSALSFTWDESHDQKVTPEQEEFPGLRLVESDLFPLARPGHEPDRGTEHEEQIRVRSLHGNSAGEDLELPTFLRRTMD